MTYDVVLVGGTPGSAWTAATLAARGARVLWIDPAGASEGWDAVPVDLGRWRASAGPARPDDPAQGPLVPVEPSSGLFAGARVHALPLGPADALGLLGADGAIESGWGLARVRARDVLSHLVSTWSEIRTYRDWVTWRYGRPVFEALHAGYCARRWGAPDRVGAAVARLHHAGRPVDAWVAPAGGPAEALSAARARVEAAGGAIRPGADVARLVVRGDRVEAIHLDDGASIPVEGALWVARPPALVAAWLGDALSPEVHAHAARLVSRARIEVLFPAGAADLPEVVHLARGPGPFFRVSRPDRLPGCAGLDGWVLLHGSAGPGDALSRATDAALAAAASATLTAIPGVRIRPGTARVRRLVGFDAAWTLESPGAWLRVLAAFERLGIRTAGREGAFGHLDPAGEGALAEALLDPGAPPLREVHRLRVDPPFEPPRGRGELARFVEA